MKVHAVPGIQVVCIQPAQHLAVIHVVLPRATGYVDLTIVVTESSMVEQITLL